MREVERCAAFEPPAYGYVPGLWPHPFADAAGHRFDADAGEIDLAADWRACRPYLVGIDLFNLGYYWEAHEAWERLWHAAGRQGLLADFFKGLIQLAVSGVKVREGRPDGAVTHARRAAELFTRLAESTPRQWGLDLGSLIDQASAVAREPPTPQGPRCPVEIVFEWKLRPSNA